MHLSNDGGPGRATVYRMVLPDHVCPYGLKALRMLERNGFEIEDRPLTSREETDAFKSARGLATTPLIFIADECIGGADDLEHWLEQRH